MPRYKVGSGIAKMWAAYESGGKAAATAAGLALGLAAATVKTRVEGWEREQRKGGPPVKQERTKAEKPQRAVEAKIEPAKQVTKPKTKERLLGILYDSKQRGASSFLCTNWLAEAQQLVKLGYAIENKKFKDAFSITEAGERSLKRQRKEK